MKEGAYMNGNAIHVSKDDLANSIVLFGSSPYNMELAKASFELAKETIFSIVFSIII